MSNRWTRRAMLQSAGAIGLAAVVGREARGAEVRISEGPPAPATRPEGDAMVAELDIAETGLRIAGRRTNAITLNGTLPGPLLRFREGGTAVIRVTNRLREDTSVHWHGLLVPPDMDGVPGVSFPGIRPGETFEYRFPLRQYGTYWYHSHSGLQEQLGHLGPLVIDPADGRHPFDYDREHFVVLSDWTFENPYRVLSRLKKDGEYYNRQRQTVFDLFADFGRKGLVPTMRDRLMWSGMRMDPTDILDVTGATYTYLVNGTAPDDNWTALFRPGERVLLHFINAAANTYFDVRIPGLPMTVVETNGQWVHPVETDEFRIAVAETFNVLVQPQENRAYTLFAESMDRSGYARGTLAPRAGLRGELPRPRPRPLLTMADMGMAHDGDPEHGAHNAAASQPASKQGSARQDSGAHQAHGEAGPAEKTPAGGGHAGHDTAANAGPAGVSPPPHDSPGGEPPPSNAVAEAGAVRTEHLRPPGTLPPPGRHERSTHGAGNAAVPEQVRSRLDEPGIGLGADGWRVLVYSDLRALEPRPTFRAPTREVEMHLTGNMERFMWSIDGIPFAESAPVALDFGERLRLTLVNDTMMNHPMHLHGMWMELENGHAERIPRVHTINVKPAERLSLLIDVDAPGRWAFHCHMLYHMEVGMFRVVEVARRGEEGGHAH